jgi:hypothetical protein
MAKPVGSEDSPVNGTSATVVRSVSRGQRIGRSTALSQASRPSAAAEQLASAPCCGQVADSPGLTRLVNGRKRRERVGPCGAFCRRRRPLPNRIQCGCAIGGCREGMAPALSGDECQSWADHPVMVARTPQHPGTAPAHPSRPAAPGLVTRAVDPAVHPDVSGFSESAPDW